MANVGLVVMAGGLGSRFGGAKQLAEVGPNGEALLDFAIRDAHAAGATRTVVVARSDLDDSLRAHLRSHHSADMDLEVVHQDAHGPSRTKPWGTGHAVVAASVAVDGPVVVLNADDFYGKTGVTRVVRAVDQQPDRAVMLGFSLASTLPAEGWVSRGVCRVGRDGRLEELVETHGIGWEGSAIASRDPLGVLPPDMPVSMNIFGLPRSALDTLADQWEAFYVAHAEDPSVEFLLPEALDTQRRDGLLEVDVIQTDEEWIGLTNPEDLEVARALFANR